MKIKSIMRRTMASSVLLDIAVKPFETIPGPKALPLIGGFWKYFPIVGNFDMNRLHVTGFRMQKEYGKIVKQTLMSGIKVVYVFDPNDIEKVYKSEGKYPARRSHIAVEHYRLSRPDLYNTGGILPTNGTEWWRLRSSFQKSLARIQDVRLYLPTADIIIEKYLNTVIGKGVHFDDFLVSISKLNMELIWAVLFGNRLDSFNPNKSDPKVSRIIEAAESINSSVLSTDITEVIWKRWKTPLYKQMEKNLQFIESVVEEQLNKTKVFSPKDGTLIDNYLKCQEVDLKDIRGMIVDLILGGVDTTSYTMCFIMYHLSRNKRVQELLREEALNLLPDAHTPITSSVLNNAVYSRAILKETFRMNPIATGISRILDKDAVLSGYVVPKGTLVVTHNLVACRLEENFKNAGVFLPERWLRDSKDFCNVSPYLVLPFSHGIRTCIARRLAEQNLLAFILKVGRNFSLEWKGTDLDIVTPLLCKPDKPVSVTFKAWENGK